MLQGWRNKVVTMLLHHDCTSLFGTTLQQVWEYQQSCQSGKFALCWEDISPSTVFMFSTYFLFNFVNLPVHFTNFTTWQRCQKLLAVFSKRIDNFYITNSANTTCWRLVSRLATSFEILRVYTELLSNSPGQTTISKVYINFRLTKTFWNANHFPMQPGGGHVLTTHLFPHKCPSYFVKCRPYTILLWECFGSLTEFALL